MKYECEICKWVYDENVEGIPFSEQPEDYTCPACGADKEQFTMIE